MLSHLPAIALVPDVELVAVATSKAESARAAGAAFGVDEYYANATDLARSSNVDVVSVAVKVPYHAEIVRAAIDAGKHVLCEWPLALNVEEAEALTHEAAHAGVRCGIGLQGRMNPAARRARDVIAAGLLGRPLSVSVFASTEGHAAALPAGYAYLCDDSKGANMSTILTGHVLDLAIEILGPLTEVQAMTAIKYPHVKLTDREGYVGRDTPDYLSVQGRFDNGAMLSAELDGGRPGNTSFRFEIVGTNGTMALHGGHPYGFQAGELRLESSVVFEAPDSPAAPGLSGPTANVGELYARFAQDIRSGEHQTPDFAHAARLHRLLRSVRRAAATGERQQDDGWPQG